MLFSFLMVVGDIMINYALILHIAFLLLIVLFLMILGYLIIVLKLRFFLLLVFLRLLVVDGLVVLHLRRLVDEVIHLFLALFMVHLLVIGSLLLVVILLVFLGDVLDGFFTVLCLITLILLLFKIIWLLDHVITLFLHLFVVLLLLRGGLVVLHAIMHFAKVLFRSIDTRFVLLIPILVVLLHLVLMLIFGYEIVQKSFWVVINLILHWKLQMLAQSLESRLFFRKVY